MICVNVIDYEYVNKSIDVEINMRLVGGNDQ
jgi:hypothetical protein